MLHPSNTFKIWYTSTKNDLLEINENFSTCYIAKVAIIEESKFDAFILQSIKKTIFSIKFSICVVKFDKLNL